MQVDFLDKEILTLGAAPWMEIWHGSQKQVNGESKFKTLNVGGEEFDPGLLKIVKTLSVYPPPALPDSGLQPTSGITWGFPPTTVRFRKSALGIRIFL